MLEIELKSSELYHKKYFWERYTASPNHLRSRAPFAGAHCARG